MSNLEIVVDPSSSGVKTNIIGGFLGSGKSTNILKLLREKPEKERWAILVNEFGEVGIDGALLSQPENPDIFVREVPGGCMCCSSGIPLHMALNMLLARAKPDRLIIEPSGLGHPRELIEALTEKHYRSLLSMGATITLIDARKMSTLSYINNPIFKEQAEVADVVFASKSDLYEGNEINELKNYLESLGLVKPPRIIETPSGKLSLNCLEEISRYQPSIGKRDVSLNLLSLNDASDFQENERSFPADGFLRFKNLGRDFESFGWIFESSFVFEPDLITVLFERTDALRIKATLQTKTGVKAFNFSGDTADQLNLTGQTESRVEVIALPGFSDQEFEQSLRSATSLSG